MLRILAFAALATLIGCTQAEVDRFRKVPDASADEAYVRQGVDFSTYRRLMPYPLEIYFFAGQGSPDPAVLERIRGIFGDAFLNAIGDDYEIVSQPGPDVLGVRASLVDLKRGEATGQLPVKGRAAALVANGELTFFMELTDSRSGKVLGRAADREKPQDQRFTVSDQTAQWLETEAAARRWAGMFRDFLDENLVP